MKDFLSQYGFIILEISISIVCLILYIFKKNKLEVKDTIFEHVLAKLPYLIANAEDFVGSGKGDLKKSYVLGVCFSMLSELTGLDSDEVSRIYGERLSDQIEYILETPQKKKG